ncbi:hypothetical protein VTO73DRAFT_1806 [Trametes versicolor]
MHAEHVHMAHFHITAEVPSSPCSSSPPTGLKAALYRPQMMLRPISLFVRPAGPESTNVFTCYVVFSLMQSCWLTLLMLAIRAILNSIVLPAAGGASKTYA